VEYVYIFLKKKLNFRFGLHCWRDIY